MKTLKISSLCIALGVLSLNLTACDKADKKADTPATATQSATPKTEAISATSTTVTTSTTATTVTTSAIAPTVTAVSSTALTATDSNTIAATATIDQVMSIMGSSMAMANKMTQQTDGKAKFSAEQIDCVATKGNDVAAMDMQAFLQKNFSPTEMKQMNDYFASPTGKKQSDMTKTMMAALVKDSKDLPKIDVSDKDKKDMQAFWQGATGSKLGALLKNKEKLKPVMTKIMEKKQVDCNLPKADTAAKPTNAKAVENKAK